MEERGDRDTGPAVALGAFYARDRAVLARSEPQHGDRQGASAAAAGAPVADQEDGRQVLKKLHGDAYARFRLKSSAGGKQLSDYLTIVDTAELWERDFRRGGRQ
jgi:hypothetical protein